MNKILLNKGWSIAFDNKTIPSNVPGDITIDMFNAGLITDPYVAENYKDAEWVGRKDYIYKKDFEIDAATYAYDVINLTFKGIDLFADIYVNGTLIGSTKNAFLAYTFDIKKVVKVGSNTLEVKMKSTLNAMDQIDTTGYYAIFNLPRIFLRKAQCHFGWDWAPKICAYGIIDDVYVEPKNRHQIENVQVISDDKGNAKFLVRVNYDNKNLKGPNEEILKKGEPMDNDKIVLSLAKKPGSKEFDKYEIDLMGVKNFIAFNKKDAELWWPNGYGTQPLYDYKVELYRGGKVVDEYQAKMAFRTVEVREEPKPGNLIGMDFYINGKKIFLKGSNWVPPECFTGVMADEKYERMIKLAKDMNSNILRVWGGGAYEKDIFFDLCDKYGILTWQDVALACADIPEDNKEFLDNLLEEVTFQVKRLRNHPSLIYWCGGNEKTGCYGNCITHGDFLVNVTLYGLVKDLDPTRPYRRQSPHSYSDIGNDKTSGDSHHNSFESCLTEGVDSYRTRIAKTVVPFVSESAVMGPSSEETLRKIFPEDKLWPMNEMWTDRFMDNPYSGLSIDFPHREMKYAEDLYGKVSGLTDFVKKAQSAEAEALRAEAEFVRANKEVTGAFLNWMYDDIWPSGTWSILDYWLEPKQGYYALRKSFKPKLVSFYYNKDGYTHLFVDNQSFEAFDSEVIVQVKKIDGTVLKEFKFDVNVGLENIFDQVIDYKDFDYNTYLAAYYNDNGKQTVLYSPSMYGHVAFESKYDIAKTRVDEHTLDVKIRGISFVKSLFMHFKDNYKYLYSDNYIDLEKGQEVVVRITSENAIKEDELMIETF